MWMHHRSEMRHDGMLGRWLGSFEVPFEGSDFGG